MRILYVTDGFPYPLTSGLLRHYYFMRELSARHSVTLLSLVEREVPAEHLEALRPFTVDRRTFTFEDPPASFARRAVRRLLGRNPYDSAVARLGETATQLERERPFDAVLYSGWRTTAVLDHVTAPVIADLCDSARVRMRSRLPTLRLRRLPLALLYYGYARHLESRLLRRASHALLASPRDREALGARATARASVVPNGVDLDYWRRSSAARGLDTIVFTGAMHYRPNVDAALHLVEHILPAVRRELPEARLQIVGRDPAPALQAVARQPGVTLTGFVEDMRPYLEQATVFAAPIRFGAGIQNKLLEALAMELPVVTSPIAAEGLRTEAGDAPPVRVVRDHNGFARELVAQLRAARTDARPIAESRRYVEQHFRWQGIGEALERVLERVAHGRGRS